MKKILICLSILALSLLQSPAYSQDESEKHPLPVDWLEVLLNPGGWGDVMGRFHPGAVAIDNAFTGHTFFSPPGLDIVDVEWKVLAKIPTVMILYSNGTGQLIEILTDGSKLVQFFDVNSASKQLFKRIKGDDLYTISSGGAYISRDSAKTWQPNNDGLAGVTERNDLALDSSQNIWLASNAGLHKQALTSNTWTSVPAAGEEGVLRVYVDRLDRIWIKSYSWLKVSSDGGASFVDAPEGLIPGTFIRFGEDLAGNIYVVAGIAEFNGAGSAVYRSAGGTAPFERIDQSISSLFENASKNPYTSISGGDTLWLGTVAGGFRSTDKGVSWTHEPRFEAASINSLIPQGSNGVVATMNGVYRRTTNLAWEKTYPETGFESGLRILSDKTGSKQYLIASKLGQNASNAAYFMIYRSTDLGATWTPDTVGGSAIGMSQLWADAQGDLHAVGHIEVTGVGPVLRAWKKPWGGSWSLNMSGIPEDLDFNFALQTLGGGDALTLLAIQDVSQQRSIIFRQVPGEATWENYVTLNGMALGFAGKVGTYTVATQRGVGVFNAGITMLPLPESVKLADLNYSIAAVSESGRIWAWFETFDEVNNRGIGSGIFYTDDKQTWQKALADLDTIQMSQLIASGDSLFAITQTRGVYVIHDPETGRAPLPTEAREVVITPNPARTSVTISLGESISSNASVVVIDASGARVLEGTYSINDGNLEVDVRELPSGTYWLDVIAGDTRYPAKFVKL